MQVIIKKNLVLSATFLITGILTNCYSENIERLQDKQFKLQTEIIRLNKEKQNNNKKNSQQNQKVAGLHTDFDDHTAQLRYIKGEIDTIKKGFKLGKLPNTPYSSTSIDARIKNLDQKFTNLEITQGEILKLLENMEKSTNSASKNNRRKITNLKKTEKAFQQKRYTHIIKDLPKLIKSSKGSTLWNFRYYYAESLFKVGKIRQSALAFKKIETSKHLSGYKKRMIKLRLGDCFRHLGDKKTALVYYSELLEKYPKSKEAKYAIDYLKKLKKS